VLLTAPEVAAPEEAEDVSLEEDRMDRSGARLVKLLKPTPVEPRLLVVDSVETGVEHEPVLDAAHEIPRVVVGRIRVTADVLEIVDEHHRPGRKKGRDAER